MAPGSLADWPPTQQRELFSLLGDLEKAIGVHLTDSCLMVPNKFAAGVRFAVEESFESCELCGVGDCPRRRAPHDSELYERKYRVAGASLASWTGNGRYREWAPREPVCRSWSNMWSFNRRWLSSASTP